MQVDPKAEAEKLIEEIAEAPSLAKAPAEFWKVYRKPLVARAKGSPRIRGAEIGMIFQEPMTALNPVHPIGRQIAEGLRRLQAIGAKVLVSFLLGIVSMAVLMIGATIGLGADWGDPVSVSVLVVLGVLAATGVMALVSAIAKTVEAAGNIQAIIAVAFGMLGGTFVQISQDGGLLSRLSLITPHHWFIQGLNDLGGGGSIGDIVPSIVGIGLFAVVTGGLGPARSLSHGSKNRHARVFSPRSARESLAESTDSPAFSRTNPNENPRTWTIRLP